MINERILAASGRFWSKVHVTGNARDCWEWSAGLSGDGYGAIKIGGKMVRAHRIAYMLAKGDIPPDKLIRHACDNPKCCNPTHLSIGTPADNARDMCERGRAPRGERSGRTTLNETVIRAILESNDPHATVARRYGLTAEHVGMIRAARCWKHVRAHQTAYQDGRFGERSVHHKLTHNDVVAILASTESQSALARKYNVNQASISHIKRGNLWRSTYAEFCEAKQDVIHGS